QSFGTALRLADPAVDDELVAAGNLNLANALFAIGTTDQAFEFYMARELSPLPFDNPLTELLFRESFARVALREGFLDVALDQSSQAKALSRALPKTPRFAALAALYAAATLLAERFEDAVEAYDEAARLYREKGDLARVVP